MKSMTCPNWGFAYASVVARDTVHIALLLAVLNDLDIKICDVLNVYITVTVTEKIWPVLRPKFGSLKSAGAAFRERSGLLWVYFMPRQP